MSTPASSLPPTDRLGTLRQWLEFAESQYAARELSLGQVATSAHDEALYLMLRALDWPLESDFSVLSKPLTAEQRNKLRETLTRRIVERTPAGYITREAFLGEHRFYVDERVIIPRSYFLELIPGELQSWLPRSRPLTRMVDVCTGSACLAILLAHEFSRAQVDAIDLSPAALEVARINVADHGLETRVRLHRSDVFDTVPPARYDLILSNPPYEPSSHCDRLPPEFQREPRLALDGGADGLDIIRKILRQSRERLAADGVVALEVGGLQPAMDREFAALKPAWLPTQDGSNCVCVITADRLLKHSI